MALDQSEYLRIVQALCYVACRLAFMTDSHSCCPPALHTFRPAYSHSVSRQSGRTAQCFSREVRVRHIKAYLY